MLFLFLLLLIFFFIVFEYFFLIFFMLYVNIKLIFNCKLILLIGIIFVKVLYIEEEFKLEVCIII